MSKCQGFQIKLRLQSSDRKTRRFKLGLRDSKEFNGVVWNASFDVQQSNAPVVGKIPFAKLTPTLFARTMPNPPAFRRDNVAGLQFVYSKFDYDGAMNPNFFLGDLDLEIVDIKAY
jgi:Complex I intermediate-associated protein 30 (CIA30)